MALDCSPLRHCEKESPINQSETPSVKQVLNTLLKSGVVLIG
jgi:hypothetical protein